MSDKNHTQGEHGNGRMNPAGHGAPTHNHGIDKTRIEEENEKWKQSQQEKEKEQQDLDTDPISEILPKEPEF